MPDPRLIEVIQVQANPPPTFTHHGEAHRMWPGDELVRVEVWQYPNDADPPPVKVTRFKGTKQEVEEDAPDPHRIGMRSYKLLRDNKRIRILGDGQSAEVRGDVEVAAARAEVSRVSSELVEARTENARLKEELESLLARVSELETDAARATKGEAEKPSETPKAPETDKGKGKGK